MSEQGWAVRARGKIPASGANISGASTDWTVDGQELDGQAEVDRATELIERARAGDREAFGELYREHHAAIFRLARFHLGGAAEDAVAETFLRAWKALPRYRATGAPFVAWLYGIARHVVTDEHRRNGRSEPRESVPDKGVEFQHEDRLVLAAAIARLSGDHRRVIEMKYMLGMKNPEVAAKLGKSVGAVNAMQWRALKQLKELMEDER